MHNYSMTYIGIITMLVIPRSVVQQDAKSFMIVADITWVGY